MTTSDLTAADCERIFHAALSKGDTKGVEAALVGVALRDPHRAQDLLDITKVALKVAGDPSLRPVLQAALQPAPADQTLREDTEWMADALLKIAAFGFHTSHRDELREQTLAARNRTRAALASTVIS